MNICKVTLVLNITLFSLGSLGWGKHFLIKTVDEAMDEAGQDYTDFLRPIGQDYLSNNDPFAGAVGNGKNGLDK